MHSDRHGRVGVHRRYRRCPSSHEVDANTWLLMIKKFVQEQRQSDLSRVSVPVGTCDRDLIDFAVHQFIEQIDRQFRGNKFHSKRGPRRLAAGPGKGGEATSRPSTPVDDGRRQSGGSAVPSQSVKKSVRRAIVGLTRRAQQAEQRRLQNEKVQLQRFGMLM